MPGAIGAIRCRSTARNFRRLSQAPGPGVAMFGLTVLLVAAGSIVVCHVLAGRRGANPVYWGVMGLLFGPLAIPFAMFAEPERRPPEDSDY